MTDPAATDGGIVDIGVLAVDALQHHEMIEIPVDDARRRHRVQRRRLEAEALCDKPIAPRGPDDIARLAAVARDAAGDTKLFQRNPGAVMGKHDRKRGGAAFDRLHLENDRRALRPPPPRPETAAGVAARFCVGTTIHLYPSDA